MVLSAKIYCDPLSKTQYDFSQLVPPVFRLIPLVDTQTLRCSLFTNGELIAGDNYCQSRFHLSLRIFSILTRSENAFAFVETC